MKPVKRVKAAAAAAPQSRDECAALIRQLGDLQRESARRGADMNDAIAGITAAHQPELDRLAAAVKATAAAIQTWCEANRDQITDARKTKTANLLTGEVAWRQRPPSVALSNVEQVLKTLKMLGLTRYIRGKEEVDKDAILAAHAAARSAPQSDPGRAALVAEAERVAGVSGIRVVTGVEDFVVTPFEAEVPA